MPHQERSGEELQEDLTEYFMHAENVGEDKARKMAKVVSKEARTVGEAVDMMAKDDELREDLKEIGGVSAKTISSVVHLSGQIAYGTYRVVRTTGHAIAVIGHDYREARHKIKHPEEVEEH